MEQKEAIVSASDSPHSVLLLNERAGIVLPCSTDAFEVSSGPRRRVLEEYLGALVVYRDGSVRRLAEILFLGLWGNSVWAQAFSLINGGTRRISVIQDPLPEFNFSQVRGLVVESLQRHPEVIEQYFEQEKSHATVMELVMKSSTYTELFEALGVPEPKDALDILC